MQNNTLSYDFIHFIELLKKYEAKYLIVGGYAVGAYGYLRYTGDIDVWIDNSEENATRLFNVVKEYGVPEESLSLEMFMIEEKNVFIGQPPLRVDIIKRLSRVDFNDAFEKRTIVKVNNVDLNIVEMEDLMLLKKAAARPKDLEDLKYLERISDAIKNEKNKEK